MPHLKDFPKASLPVRMAYLRKFLTSLIMLLRRVKCQFPKREVYLASEHSYKVSTNSVAARITKVLPSLIHEDQTGYIKGRFIGQNIRLIADIIECKNAL